MTNKLNALGILDQFIGQLPKKIIMDPSDIGLIGSFFCQDYIA
jgi:hypothetical protein